jgi:taurine dioxygenase
MAHGKICMAADVSSLAMTPDLGAEVRGVDLSSPLSDACLARIMEVFHRYCVVFFRNQQLEPHHLVRFASRMGELFADDKLENVVPGLPQVRVISNLSKAARTAGLVRAGTHWHSDLSYTQAPALATLLYGIKSPPEGANLEFINMYAVFEALPAQKKIFLEKLRAVHDRSFRYAELYPDRPPLTPEQLAKMPPVEHPLVRVHPTTGRKSLFVSKEVVSHVLGLAPAESRKLIDELEAFAAQPRFVYSHRCEEGDIVVWDNRCTLHRVTPYDGRFGRMVQRVQVKGEIPIAA